MSERVSARAWSGEGKVYKDIYIYIHTCVIHNMYVCVYTYIYIYVYIYVDYDKGAGPGSGNAGELSSQRTNHP